MKRALGVVKKLQIFLAAAIVLGGGRAAYLVYERHEAMRGGTRTKREAALKEGDDLMPAKALYDLKSGWQLTQHPVWVKVGYSLAYYPYDVARHKTDFGHGAGTLLPLQKLAIREVVVTDVAPQAPGVRQWLACFALDGKSYAAPIGAVRDGDFKISSDNIFFIEDPHGLYKHWPADVWNKIDAHEVQAGMSELQASFSIGAGVPEGSGDYGSRTLHYSNGGKPLVITFQNDKAVEIKAGS